MWQGPFGGDGGEGPGRRQTGLMAGRGYGIERVCEASPGANHTRDAAMFQLVEVCVSQCAILCSLQVVVALARFLQPHFCV